MIDGDIIEADIACNQGKIVRIEPAIAGESIEEIRASGKLVLPGAIDAQVHFRDPGATHKEDLFSGSRAAVAGGVTSFLEMPNTQPPTINQQALDNKLKRAAECSVANYGFFIGATPDNLDEINRVAPVCGIKIFMGSSTGTLLVHKDEDLEKIFRNGTRLIAVHAENEQLLRQRKEDFAANRKPPWPVSMHPWIRDVDCAMLATSQAVELSRQYHRRLHVLHLTSAQEVHYLRKNRTEKITVECTPNHLFFTDNDYESLGTLVQMNPPVRSIEHQQELWSGLHDGTIDFIATDHAPHTLEEKSKPYPDSPSGMPCVETSLPLMLTAWKSERCSLAQLLKWMCWGPAEAYRIKYKGQIKEGYDADLAVVNVDDYREVNNQNLFTRVGWSPYHGRALTGWPEWTVVGGRIAYSNGKIHEQHRGTAIQFDSDASAD